MLNSGGIILKSNVRNRKGMSVAWRILGSLLVFNPLNAKLNPICHLLALLGAHHILHISRIRVNVDHAVSELVMRVVG